MDITQEFTPDALDELRHDSYRTTWGLDDLRELAQDIAEARQDIQRLIDSPWMQVQVQ